MPDIRSAVVRSGDLLTYEWDELRGDSAFCDFVCTVRLEGNACLHALDDDNHGLGFGVDRTHLAVVEISYFLHFDAPFCHILGLSYIFIIRIVRRGF